MTELSETFWALLLTTLSGFVLMALKYCYKSKCSEINLCCLKITRNVEAEVKEDLELGREKENESQSNK
jgi:hypothetical protein